MELSSALIFLAAPSVVTAFVFVGPKAGGSVFTNLDDAKIYYSTSTGNTETVASYIGTAAGIEGIDDIADASDDEINEATGLIVGAPTWHTDVDEERSGTSWDDWLYNTLPNLDISGKRVAIFGCGDSQNYGDYYCDAAEELHSQFTEAGATIFGLTSTDGYSHTASKAEIEPGKFCGLMCDEDNHGEISPRRAKKWVAQLKEEGFFV